MWLVKTTITDNDAVALTDTMRIAITVPGVALGDIVFARSITNDLSDGTDQCIFNAYVTAANTVSLQFTADAGAYAADDLNNAVVRLVIGRPTW
jgi:hypothetical protein